MYIHVQTAWEGGALEFLDVLSGLLKFSLSKHGSMYIIQRKSMGTVHGLYGQLMGGEFRSGISICWL